MSRLVAVAPALPANVYPQERITEIIGPLLTPAGTDAGRRTALDRFHAASGVTSRHLALPLEQYAELTTFRAANDHFVRLGTDIAARACLEALTAAGLRPEDVDYLLFTSVTGVSAPSVDALLVERIGLRPDITRMPSFGLGCAGGAAGLARVADHLTGHPDQVALLVSVELCSLTLQQGDHSTANLVSSGLFGDGAAAVVMVGDAHPAATPQHAVVVDSRSRLYPGTTDQLGWDVGDTGFRIVLSAGLPRVIEQNLAEDVTAMLDRHDLKVRDVGAWVVHAGGPRVLDAVRDSLDLDESVLHLSREVLAAVGNLSSASVLHVLAATLRDAPPPGTPGVVLAFGPGVGVEMVLLRWPEEAS
ncbi:type III polyketide synthase [Actinotalea sp. BY-33]|uniref:Type III polyketide synthase n=1 Tax=Actinotalea soli TaxID=2819234 RepID=A0A939LNA6_9CELL|nr:3-oxoacyl-[acyl-carrier-protein] synthase III C-terminal domain-containing protein [Actinotalea soli]MBO1750523.1 type III polyketide synthase [Actinotalea soli]